MRFCENESVDYFEAQGESLPELLRNAANVLDTLEDYTTANLVVSEGYDGERFLLGMYVN
jgi:hypothetical protein